VLDGIRPWIIQQQAEQQRLATAAAAAAEQQQLQQLQQQKQRKPAETTAASSTAAAASTVAKPNQQQQPLDEGGPDAAWAAFIDRARSNLHWVLALSPVCDTFRARCRQFPSLVSCTTADWFSPWPAEALASVAERSLGAMPMLTNAAGAAAAAGGGNAATSGSQPNSFGLPSVQPEQQQQQPGIGQFGGFSRTGSGKGAMSLVQRAAVLAVEVHTGVQAAVQRYMQELQRRWVWCLQSAGLSWVVVWRRG